MPPISGKGPGCGLEAGEVVVDLAGDVALQAAHDVELGQALVGPPLDIGPGRWVAAHPDRRDPPQGVVSPAIAAAMQPVAVGAARGRGDGGGAAQMREGGLATPPLGLSPAVTSSCPAVSIPTPGRATRVGAAALTVPAAGCRVGGARPGAAASGGPGSAGWPCRGRWTGQRPGPHRCAGSDQRLVLSPSSGWRSSSGALSSTPSSCSAAATRAFRAPRRATPGPGSSRPGPRGSWAWWRQRPRPGSPGRRPEHRSGPTCPGVAAGCGRAG